MRIPGTPRARRRLAGALAALVAVVALTACNASDGEGDDSPTTTLPASTAPGTTAAP